MELSNRLTMFPDISTSTLLILAIPLTITLFLLITNIYTNITYRLTLHRHPSPNTPTPPPILPFTIPLLGHALSFTSTTPGLFFRHLQSHFTQHPSLGALTLLLANQHFHILHAPELITKMFKLKTLSRAQFNRDIMVKAMGLGSADDRKVYGLKPTKELKSEMAEEDHQVNKDFLLSQGAVDGLTGTFMGVFQEEVVRDFGVGERREVSLYEFVRERMFVASTTALYGRKIFDLHPDLSDFYWDFDNGVLARLYGVPRFMRPEAYKALQVMLDKWEKWVRVVRERYADEPPEGTEWDEMMGSLVVRKRHRMYHRSDISDRGRASFDLGFMFGLNSNAIPATGWILSHLLSSSNSSLLADIQREVESARNKDGTIDINALITMPCLNSAFSETLRMYVDVLVTRTLDEDVTMDQYHMKKGGVIVAPSFLGHHNTNTWVQDNMPPEQTWYGERFLKQDEKTGKTVFSTAGTNGRFFPWGGGQYICPGRVFAKQEVFGAVAAFLLAYEVHFIEYLRFDKSGHAIRKGTHADGFPVVKKQFCGSGVVVSEGDMLIKLKRRVW